MMMYRMEDEQISIPGYTQMNIFTCIGLDFADSEIVASSLTLLHQHCNFRAPDLKGKNYPGSPDSYRIYKIRSKNMRKFKMQQSLSKIISKIQNDSPKLSIVDAISDLSVACGFTTPQEF